MQMQNLGKSKLTCIYVNIFHSPSHPRRLYLSETSSRKAQLRGNSIIKRVEHHKSTRGKYFSLKYLVEQYLYNIAMMCAF